jgi:hypothetical protein
VTLETQVRPVKRDRSTQVLLLIASLVAVGGIAFAIGRLSAPTAAAANNLNGAGGRGVFGRNFPSLAPGQTFNPADFAGRGGAGGGLGGFRGGVEGTVVSIDGSTMTVKLANGSTTTVNLSSGTTYHNETAATASDVKPGSQVIVQINTAALAAETPAPGASGALGGRTLTASDVLVVAPSAAP